MLAGDGSAATNGANIAPSMSTEEAGKIAIDCFWESDNLDVPRSSPAESLRCLRERTGMSQPEVEDTLIRFIEQRLDLLSGEAEKGAATTRAGSAPHRTWVWDIKRATRILMKLRSQQALPLLRRIVLAEDMTWRARPEEYIPESAAYALGRIGGDRVVALAREVVNRLNAASEDSIRFDIYRGLAPYTGVPGRHQGKDASDIASAAPPAIRRAAKDFFLERGLVEADVGNMLEIDEVLSDADPRYSTCAEREAILVHWLAVCHTYSPEVRAKKKQAIAEQLSALRATPPEKRVQLSEAMRAEALKEGAAPPGEAAP